MLESETRACLVKSCLNDKTRQWQTATEYEQSNLKISPAGFASATNVLLTQPNLNSSHLFRADIVYDSANYLKTPVEHESALGIRASTEKRDKDVTGKTPRAFADFTLTRTVVRRLIPRNPQLDEPLIQTCHVYQADTWRHLVVYLPHVNSAQSTPWYHPPVKGLAYLYERATSADQVCPTAVISVHILPFDACPSDTVVPVRLHRTLLSLLHTLSRLAKGMSQRPPETTPTTAIVPKDNIIPQHIVQNTYSRLKQTYSADLISRWVEKTEPSKHVFEDLSIAAFLIELWRQMYGVIPRSERPGLRFPGFVDIACGNGVLVYVLREEGYEGWGFDARRRRTWEVLPADVQDHLLERLLVPEPFLRTNTPASGLAKSDTGTLQQTKDSLKGLEHHSGIFKAGTFIISNHADELTPWTPILAALSNPADPLPWLAIPCCSHALSGVRHRYPALKPTPTPRKQGLTDDMGGTKSAFVDMTMGTPHTPISNVDRVNQSSTSIEISSKRVEGEDQPASGDLKALRATKTKADAGADPSSMYACLTAKVVALAEELGIEGERTLMRIPSTRNIGIIGGRRRAVQKLRLQTEAQIDEVEGRPTTEVQNGLRELERDGQASTYNPVDTTVFQDMQHIHIGGVLSEETTVNKVKELLERECKASGGVAAAAQLWIERARSLHTGQGRGKLNSRNSHAR